VVLFFDPGGRPGFPGLKGQGRRRVLSAMMLDRLWPPRKGQPVNVVMPPINTSQDLFAAIASIWTAIREGRLTPDEASALSIVIDRSIQAIELHDITKRIAALEEARDKRDEKNRPSPA
jgi:hypothetical protein